MTDAPSNSDKLIADLEEVKHQTYRRACQWAYVYYIGRGAIIIFSALTSATALTQIVNSPLWQATCALLVTVLTALDSWLKPGAKYAAYYLANDEYEALQRLVVHQNTADPNEQRYADITARLRAAVTPSKS